jgi:hypothetical protein
MLRLLLLTRQGQERVLLRKVAGLDSLLLFVVVILCIVLIVAVGV